MLHAMKNAPISIGNGIYLRKPVDDMVNNVAESENRSTTTVPAPTIILMFTWMGAQFPHLLKYSNVYTEIYPESTQIIIRSESTYFISTNKTKKAYLQPVVEVLEHLGCLPPAPSPLQRVRDADIKPLLPYTSPRVLIHTFSNGGSWQLSTLSEMLETRSSSSMKISPTALILDSCPGHGGIDGTLQAFSGVVQNPVVRSIVRFTIRIIYFYMAFRRKIFRTQPLTTLDKMKARLNDKHLLPWFSINTPRLYLYSMKDNVIPYREVETHAGQAKALGFSVQLKRFPDSPHVAHARTYPQQYWAAIQKLWEGAASNTP